jgi:hypothetical protein
MGNNIIAKKDGKVGLLSWKKIEYHDSVPSIKSNLWLIAKRSSMNMNAFSRY